MAYLRQLYDDDRASLDNIPIEVRQPTILDNIRNTMDHTTGHTSLHTTGRTSLHTMGHTSQHATGHTKDRTSLYTILSDATSKTGRNIHATNRNRQTATGGENTDNRHRQE